MAAALVYKTDWATGVKPMPLPSGPEVVNVLLSKTMTAAEVDALGVDDLVVMGYLPEDCVLVNAIFLDTDLDTGDALDLDFGVINAAEDDLATKIADAPLVAGTRHVTTLTHTSATLTLSSTSAARKYLAYQVDVVAHTPAAGTLYVSLSYRNKHHGA
ncbi:MAG: hypothetical protein EOM21_19460 [Gammaproteobacteria bacterium]|nr:hypothetical protein [Gammaproteobacteria bacterium]